MVLPKVNTVFNLYTRKLYTKKAVSSYDICYYQLRTMSYLNVYCRASLKGLKIEKAIKKSKIRLFLQLLLFIDFEHI